MNTVTKIGTIEAIGFMIIVMINRIILNTPKDLIETGGSSSWLNVILVSIIAILLVLLICKLQKNFTGKDILDISKYLAGDKFKKITSFIFFVLFIYVSALVIRNFSDSLQKIFLQNTPITYIMLFFIVGMIWANKLGLSAIIKINMFIVGLVLLSILIIFITPAQYFNASNLFPILGNGINETFFSGLTNIFAFSGITYLYFLMPLLNKPQHFKKIALISVIIAAIYLLLSVISLLGLFSYLITSEDIFSILLITRVISFGAIFERLDAIFLFIWILAFLTYLSFILYFSLYTYKGFTNISNQNGPIYTIAALIFTLALFPKNVIEINFLENDILKVLVLTLLFAFPIIIYILANLKHKRTNRLPQKEWYLPLLYMPQI